MSIKHVRQVLKNNPNTWLSTRDIHQKCQDIDRDVNVDNSLKRMRSKYSNDNRLCVDRKGRQHMYHYKWQPEAEAAVKV